MNKHSRKLLAFLLSMAMLVFLAGAAVIAEGEEPAQAYSASITVTDSTGAAHVITGEQIQSAEKVEVTEEEPWTYNDQKAFGTFYSFKSILSQAGIDYSEVHGLKGVASDGFVTGFSKDNIDELYIFDMSTVNRGGSYGTAGTYGTAINGSAGNKWGTDIASFELVNSHVWFVKKGACKHYCSICNEDEPCITVNPGTEGEVKVYDCQIKAAASETATAENPWTGGKNSYTGTFYSLKSILENANIDSSEAHGFTTTASDGFTNGFAAEEIDKVYIYDMGTVMSGDAPAGAAGTYGTALNGGKGNKWARDVVSLSVVKDHVMFVKNGECKHYCAICNEPEQGEVVEPAVDATCTTAGKTAVIKYACGGQAGGEEVAALGHQFLKDGVCQHVCQVCGEAEPSEEVEPAVAATYTSKGKTAVIKYACGAQAGGEETPMLAKKAQPMTVKARTISALKAATLKKKALKFKASKLMTIKKAKGTKSFKITKVNKYKTKFAISKKTGQLTVKKGLKKGTYKVTVQVKAAGTDMYKAGSQKVTLTIRVK